MPRIEAAQPARVESAVVRLVSFGQEIEYQPLHGGEIMDGVSQHPTASTSASDIGADCHCRIACGDFPPRNYKHTNTP